MINPKQVYLYHESNTEGKEQIEYRYYHGLTGENITLKNIESLSLISKAVNIYCKNMKRNLKGVSRGHLVI